MPENIPADRQALFAFGRFLASLLSLVALALGDLYIQHSEVPNVVYYIIGGLNGVDAYKLYKEINK